MDHSIGETDQTEKVELPKRIRSLHKGALLPDKESTAGRHLNHAHRHNSQNGMSDDIKNNQRWSMERRRRSDMDFLCSTDLSSSINGNSTSSDTHPLFPRRRFASGDFPSTSATRRLMEERDDETYETDDLTSGFCRSSSDNLFSSELRQRRRGKTLLARQNSAPSDESSATVPASNGVVIRRSRSRRGVQSRWVVPMDHPLKTAWDILTVVLSIANAYAMHLSIRERNFAYNPFFLFCDAWFFLDILLNFVTERKTPNGEILRDYRSICARYLTSWFAVDALALCPWETLYVKPIIDLQNRRGFFQRSFFRSKAVVRVTRHLRGRHFRWFGTVARHTKQHGVGAQALLRFIINYVPKYLLWLRNTKGVVAVRILRQFHWFRRFYKNMVLYWRPPMEKSDGMTGSITREEYEDDLSSKCGHLVPGRSQQQQQQQHFATTQIIYEPWELMDDDDDDGVPL